MVDFGEFLKILNLRSNSVPRQIIMKSSHFSFSDKKVA